MGSGDSPGKLSVTSIMRMHTSWYFLLTAVTLGYSMVASTAPVIIPSPPELAAAAYVLVDAESGEILVSHNVDQRLPPASLTKMMTSYIAAGELEKENVDINDLVEVSIKAWQMGGSKMYIREGTKVSFKDLLKGVIIQSGNDASVAVAEHVAGSEEAFADVMNQQAVLLGMTDTHFVNSTGWPDEDHYTTAKDMTTLAIALIADFPDHYKMYSEKYFTYGNIRQPNRNSLLWRDNSVDGIKTGHTEAAGYCLVASAIRDGMRLVSVVMGVRSEESRAAESQKLLTYGFRYFETLRLYEAEEVLSTVRVWGGKDETVRLGLAEAVVLTTPRGTREDLTATMDINAVIEAPVKVGQVLGKLSITQPDAETLGVPIVALKSVDEAGFFTSLWDTILLFFLQLIGMDTLH
jgi:D-alanyl-D-alanine carboxypeptidase (penicillin-binding protein 5/6)